MTDVSGAQVAGPGFADGLRDEPLEVDVTATEVVFEGRVWDIRSDTFAYNDHPTVRDYVDHSGAVAVLAMDDQGRVLLIQQYRHPIKHRDWEIPAGLLDVDGEPPAETAKRELAEEVDLVAAHWEPLVTTFATPGGSNEIIHLFLASGLSAAPEVHAREAEEADIRIAWVPLADAVTAVLEGRMRNAILGIGVLAASEKLRRAAG
ncbi:MAG TPA: NUDIX hydrolase [Microbacterium sp.]|uniref:NUDIX hydrolase n=1 Tax=Microbacterium sp. TaxID=51671 RepID=UPI002BF28586|nr:NUDIX hydrolase [Microbacterium sp.]HWI31760.1 NUDIX hydrolase [Microbacterium sp.]